MKEPAGQGPEIRYTLQTTLFNDGAAVYWDADGNPLGGTAGTGAATRRAVSASVMAEAISSWMAKMSSRSRS